MLLIHKRLNIIVMIIRLFLLFFMLFLFILGYFCIFLIDRPLRSWVGFRVDTWNLRVEIFKRMLFLLGIELSGEKFFGMGFKCAEFIAWFTCLLVWINLSLIVCCLFPSTLYVVTIFWIKSLFCLKIRLFLFIAILFIAIFLSWVW